MTEEFIIFGLYQFVGVRANGKIKIDLVNVNPQTVFGANVDGQPKIDIKGNIVTAKWIISDMEEK